MAKTYNKMLMDVNGKIGNIVTEVQGDQNSRYLDINLFNNGIPIDLTGHTVRIYMRRPNTNPLEEFFNDGEITEATRGRCQFLLSTQALAKEGELEAQVSIWKGTEEILSTQVFKIMVTKKLRTSGSVESSNEYGALVVLFQNLYEAHDLMTTMVESFGESGETAASVPATTFWQMLEAVYRVNADALANASVQGVLDLIGNTADTGGSDTAGTVMGKLNSTLNGGVKVVKSVQRGTYVVNNSGNHSISISSIDPDKSIAIIDAPSGATGSSGSGNTYCIFAGLNTDELIVYSYNHTNYTIGWQIIEFY